MEGGFGKGARAGDPYPKLLDLIPNGGGWSERGREEGGGRESLKLAEQKLELRLAPPGAEDWPVEKEHHKEDPSAFSLGTPCRTSSRATIASAGAKRGFSDTLESQIHGFQQQQQQQKTSFLHLASAPGLVRDSSQKVNGMDAEQQQGHQSLEGKAGSAPSVATPSSGNAAATPNSSQARTAASPVVGWPPIRSFRKNLTSSSSSKPPSVPQNGNSGKNQRQEIPNKGKFVKINMDGVPIGRKVDLKAHDSYEKLSAAVDELFRGLLAAQRETPASGCQCDGEAGPGQAITGLLDGSGEYTLVYEDDEGDKLLVGDVPWDMFVCSVKRLRVLKSSELSALSVSIPCISHVVRREIDMSRWWALPRPTSTVAALCVPSECRRAAAQCLPVATGALHARTRGLLLPWRSSLDS
ncbi:hypothetical protein Taro_007757 [Colocasia esculenta]|uniref:Auxin-responsive protein n=1 Tax=Colocasia esculenta TaxID=4460 RepID=A0A843TS39_COLES|nr:hypothetical protein [Colocasia esculenta]